MKQKGEPEEALNKGPKFDIIKYRHDAAKQLPSEIGVYALCDLDNVPIYVGQSQDGIGNRVRRHLTSARSDVIANRQVDVWEIAWVRCWPLADEHQVDQLEAYLFEQFHAQSPLMNGSVLKTSSPLDFAIPEPQSVQIMPDDEIQRRRRIDIRLPRQAKHFTELLDHYLNVKSSKELHLALQAHFQRLTKYFNELHT